MNFEEQMYFPEGYLSEELKNMLISLEIVSEIEKPTAFEEVEEEDFVRFLQSKDVPCEFLFYENGNFHPWTIKLLEIVAGTENNSQEFYQLVDTLLFHQLYEGNPNFSLGDIKHNMGENWERFYMPVQCQNGSYSTASKCHFYHVSDEAYESAIEQSLVFRILNDKYESNEKNYAVNVLNACNYTQITPKELCYPENTHSEKYPLTLWKWVYKFNHETNQALPLDMAMNLIEGLENNGYTEEETETAQVFLLDILREHPEVIRGISGTIQLPLHLIGAYLETVDDCYGKDLKITLEPVVVEETDISNIIGEILDKVQLHQKFEEIKIWFAQIYIVTVDFSIEESFARCSNNTLILKELTITRDYYNSLLDFLEREFHIKLDKKDRSMTQIDNSNSFSVSKEVPNEFFSEENLGFWRDFQNNNWKSQWTVLEKKRLLMECYDWGDLYLRGYGISCPLCQVAVPTEITGMRIKELKVKKENYEFLCCGNCASLFDYCEGEPELQETENFQKVTLKFHLLSENFQNPREFTFEPTAVHRALLIAMKGD